MPDDFKKTLDSLPQKRADRGRQSIYVSKSIWEKFKKLTAKVGTSLALETLMEQAIEDAEKKR